MDNKDLEYIIDYAKRNGMMQKPFIEVINAWTSELKKAYEESEADMYNATIEAHEQ